MSARARRALLLTLATALMMVITLGEAPPVPRAHPLFNPEIESLRRLAAAGDQAALAEAFERSVVRISAGEFWMGDATGSADERPQHLVYLDLFEIDRYEVTQVQYQSFLKATGRKPPPYWSGSAYPPGQADYPVVGVSWAEAEAYCHWAGKRLPSEAEWEKACRGPEGRSYPWGETWDASRANVDVSPRESGSIGWEAAWTLLGVSGPDPGGRRLRPVGSYPDGASVYGVFDLVGNASEWVLDWYNWTGYESLPTRNPRGLGPPWNHCVRGSAWFDPFGQTAWIQAESRCSARNSSHVSQDPRVGFRCARSVPQDCVLDGCRLTR